MPDQPLHQHLHLQNPDAVMEDIAGNTKEDIKGVHEVVAEIEEIKEPVRS